MDSIYSKRWRQQRLRQRYIPIKTVLHLLERENLQGILQRFYLEASSSSVKPKLKSITSHIDFLAVDKNSNSDILKTIPKIRKISLAQKGVYIDFLDQGACMSILSVKIYYTTCPRIIQNLAVFPVTPAEDLESVKVINGTCVANAEKINQLESFLSLDVGMDAGFPPNTR